jgi:hypothetical protein
MLFCKALNPREEALIAKEERSLLWEVDRTMPEAP